MFIASNLQWKFCYLFCQATIFVIFCSFFLWLLISTRKDLFNTTIFFISVRSMHKSCHKYEIGIYSKFISMICFLLLYIINRFAILQYLIHIILFMLVFVLICNKFPIYFSFLFYGKENVNINHKFIRSYPNTF